MPLSTLVAIESRESRDLSYGSLGALVNASFDVVTMGA